MRCFIEPLAALKMKYYVASVDAEISGVGKTRMVGEDIYVEDVIIFKQKCTSAHTDIDQDDEMRVMYERDQAGESSKNWNLWWHSHNSMGVFWSGTDNNNVLEQANGGGYLLSIVTNNKGDLKTRFDIFPKDVSGLGVITYYKVEDDIPTTILPSIVDNDRRIELEKLLETLTDKKEDNKKLLDEEYSTSVTEAQEQIKAWAAVAKEKVNEKEARIKEYNKLIDEENKLLLQEYDLLTNGELVEDELLKKAIDDEVKLKVTLPYTRSYNKDYLKPVQQYLSTIGKNEPKYYNGYGSYDDDDDDNMYGGTSPDFLTMVDVSEGINDDFEGKLIDVKNSSFCDEDNYSNTNSIETDEEEKRDIEEYNKSFNIQQYGQS